METYKKTIQGGNPDGKSVLILSGVHGDEITPIYTIAKMIREKSFNLKNIRELHIINGVNISGLRNNSREFKSINTSDINRIFNDGVSFSEIKDFVREMIIEKSDVVIDLHSSPSCTEFALIDIDEYTMSMKNWCDNSNLKTTFRYSSAYTIKRFCLEYKKPSLTIEINNLNTVDYKSCNNTINIINSLLENIQYAEINKSIPDVKSLIEVKTYQEGIIIPKCKNGDGFVKGQLLYKIISLDGELIADVLSTFDGYVVCEPMYHYIKRGDIVYITQPI